MERLQEIQSVDIVREGLGWDKESEQIPNDEIEDYLAYQFSFLWDSINGKKYPWGSNPWVWVIEFKVV